MVTAKKISLVIIILMIAAVLHSQDGSSRVVRTDDGLQIFQTIYFHAVPNVLRYEVEIERIIDTETILIDVITTTVNRVEVSLRAGYYRYRVTAYNRMTLLEGISPWQDFRVISSISPEIDNYRPVYGLYLEMANPNGTLTIYGTYFFDDTEFALVKKNPNYNWSEVSLDGRDDVIFPSHVEVSSNQVNLSFTWGSLQQGNYEIFARNPGGMWASFGEVRVGLKNTFDFTAVLDSVIEDVSAEKDR